jgi:tetratricopeptide (TPR) repeat protein
MMSRLLAIGFLLVSLANSGCSKDPEVAKREFLQSGDRYAAEGRHAEAVIEYRNALQQDPTFGAAQARLAESYWALNDRANGAPAFVRAADLLPDDIDVQIRAGNILLVERRFEDAINRAERVLAVQPSHAGALVLRANGLAGLSRLEEAVADIEQAVRTDPDRPEIYGTLGAVQLVRGDHRQAEAAFKRAVEADPSSAQAHLALANFYLATGNQAATEASLRAAIGLEPQHVLANRALAYFYIGAGRAAEAEPYLKLAAEASSDASGQMGLAEYYVSQRRMEDARQWFERVAAGKDRLAPTARVRLATLDFTAGNLAEATRRIDEILTSDPSNTRALTARAELLAARGDLDGALAAARRATESDRSWAQARYALGKVHVLRREPAEASAAFSTALQLNPRLVPARVELAALHLAAGQLEQAEQMAQSALAVVPTATDARLMLGRVLLARRDTARAEPIIRDLDRLLPQSSSVATAVGQLELQKNQPARARSALERALTLQPDGIEPLRLLTGLDLRERRPQAARDRLALAMRDAPANADVKLLAASTAAALGQTADAEQLARAALGTDPAAIDAYAVLGGIYLRSGRLVEATEEFKQLAERQPRSVAAHTTVGMLLQMQDRIDEARAVFERVIDLDPNAAVAANNLAWIYAERGGNLDTALKLAQTAKARLPNRPEVNDTLGWVLHKKGLNDVAIAAITDAIRLDPDNAMYHHHLGLAHAAAGDRANARAALSRALSVDRHYSAAAEVRAALDGLGE